MYTFASVTSSYQTVGKLKPEYFPNILFNFQTRKISPKNLIDVLNSIKNKNNEKDDATGFSNSMLYNTLGCPRVFDALLNIINSSFDSHVFPWRRKASLITLIPKISNPITTSDFRPIKN